MNNESPIVNSGTLKGNQRASRAPTTTVKNKMLTTPKTIDLTSRKASRASSAYHAHLDTPQLGLRGVVKAQQNTAANV